MRIVETVLTWDGNEELRESCELYHRELEDVSSDAITFWDKVDGMMKKRHWNSTIFMAATLLNIREYSRYMSKRDTLPSLRWVIALCIGFDVDIRVAEDILNLAGYKLTTSPEHMAYHLALRRYRGRIDACNDFLEIVGINPLGSKDRKKD